MWIYVPFKVESVRLKNASLQAYMQLATMLFWWFWKNKVTFERYLLTTINITSQVFADQTKMNFLVKHEENAIFVPFFHVLDTFYNSILKEKSV